MLKNIPSASKTITTIEMTTDTQDLEVPPAFLPGDPELHPLEMETDVLAAENLVTMPEHS